MRAELIYLDFGCVVQYQQKKKILSIDTKGKVRRIDLSGKKEEFQWHLKKYGEIWV